MVKNINLLQGLHFNNFKIVLLIMTWRRFLRGNYLQKKQVCNLSVKRLLQNCFASEHRILLPWHMDNAAQKRGWDSRFARPQTFSLSPFPRGLIRATNSGRLGPNDHKSKPLLAPPAAQGRGGFLPVSPIPPSFSLFKFWPVKVAISGVISIQRGWQLVWNKGLRLFIPRSEESGPEETHPGRVKEQQLEWNWVLQVKSEADNLPQMHTRKQIIAMDGHKSIRLEDLY